MSWDLRSAAFLLLLLGTPARAQSAPVLPEIDRDLATQHFQLGQEAYSQSAYSQALAEFEKARSIKPAPAFDYNIALCLDRLERWAEAAAAYRRFLEGSHSDDANILARISALDARAEAQRPTPITVVGQAAPPAHRRQLLAPIAVGALALVAGIAGAALVGTAVHDANTASAGCAPGCDVGGLGLRAGAGYGLLATAGIALVIDVPLWILAMRRPQKAEPR